MLYVAAEIRPSSIHGVGLFALADIAAGTLVSKWTRGYDQEFSESNLVVLPDFVQHGIRSHGWQLPDGRWRRDADAAAYVNHLDAPNCRTVCDGDEYPTYALRDIKSDEEIVENYHDWNSNFAGFGQT